MNAGSSSGGGGGGGGGGGATNGQQSARRQFVHPDRSLAPGNGVVYPVRYVGNVPVLASTRSLRPEARNRVTKAAIGMCCEAAGLLMPGRRKRDKSVVRHLGEQPVMQFSGWSANVTVSTQAITVVAMDTQETIAHHNLINVSFASGGDPDTMDFVAYVAKDSLLGRACHVIECPGGLASDVICTIGQAFELRYKGVFSEQAAAQQPQHPPSPPSSTSASHPSGSQYVDVRAESKEVPVGNLLDIGEPVDEPAPVLPPRHQQPQQPQSLEPLLQPWYHGAIRRQEAELLLRAEGDFLVRSASGQSGQFVLSGRLESGACKHLLLVDPEGRIRTRDRVFDSLQQLVAFHTDSQLPIVSEDSELLLRRPVLKR